MPPRAKGTPCVRECVRTCTRKWAGEWVGGNHQYASLVDNDPVSDSSCPSMCHVRFAVSNNPTDVGNKGSKAIKCSTLLCCAAREKGIRARRTYTRTYTRTQDAQSNSRTYTRTQDAQSNSRTYTRTQDAQSNSRAHTCTHERERKNACTHARTRKQANK
jgi:hypothetical protein